MSTLLIFPTFTTLASPHIRKCRAKPGMAYPKCLILVFCSPPCSMTCNQSNFITIIAASGKRTHLHFRGTFTAFKHARAFAAIIRNACSASEFCCGVLHAVYSICAVSFHSTLVILSCNALFSPALSICTALTSFPHAACCCILLQNGSINLFFVG